MPDREAEPQRGDPRRLGQRLQRDHVGQPERLRHHRLARERRVELVHHHERVRRRAGEPDERGRGQQRARRVVRVADEEEARARREPARDRLQRVGEVVVVGDLLDRHPLLLRARLVVAEGRRRRQERAALVAVGVEDRLDRGVHAVEGLDVRGRDAERGGERLVEPRVLRIGGVRLRPSARTASSTRGLGPAVLSLKSSRRSARRPSSGATYGVSASTSGLALIIAVPGQRGRPGGTRSAPAGGDRGLDRGLDVERRHAAQLARYFVSSNGVARCIVARLSQITRSPTRQEWR